MDASRTLEAFLSAEPSTAREAFDRLSPRIGRFVHECLRSVLASESDRDDAVASVLVRLWKYRSSFEFKGDGAWWAFVAKVARNCAYAQLGKPQAADIPAEYPDHEQRALDIAAVSASERESLYRVADEVWLKVPADRSRSERNHRLLAAQLFYLDGLKWDEVCSIIGTNQPVTRQMLDGWLSDHSVLLDAAYHALYWSNDRLTGYLLRPNMPLASVELDKLNSGDRSNITNLQDSDQSVRVIILRFRYGLISDKIAQMEPTIDRNDIESIIARAISTLPIPELVDELNRTFALNRAFDGLLTDAGLWKRLVFQYHASHELPHRQIFERTEPAATKAGYRLTLGMLNVWLSNGRLFNELGAYVSREVVYG